MVISVYINIYNITNIVLFRMRKVDYLINEASPTEYPLEESGRK